PPVLLVSTGEADGADPAAAREELGRRGLDVEVLGATSGPAGEAEGADPGGRDNDDEGDETWSGAARPVVEAWTRRAVSEGSPP
ncbi:MAG TPA: hypothetical protein VKW77_07890, partial [Acidimicrobiales bacterium]|nr:hypothetical protein [Acidimicrobiales bacterium]